MGNGRLRDIDRAKGLAIFLVVVGHIVARDFPLGNHWFEILKTAIYKFHMPYFMFLSGVVAACSFRAISGLSEYFRHVCKKAERLLPAYFIFLIFVFSCKLLAQGFFHVDNPISGLGDFFHTLFYPLRGSVGFLWFIWVLFLMYCVFPLFFMLGINSQFMIIIALAVYFVPATEFLGVDLFAQYFVFFSFGLYYHSKYDFFSILVDRIGFVFLLALAAAIFYYDCPKLVAGFLSVPALNYCVRRFGGEGRIGLGLDFLAKYTFVIYLLNTLAIGLVKAVILKFHSWDGDAFFYICPILLLAGIFIPVLVKLTFFSRFPYLSRITD